MRSPRNSPAPRAAGNDLSPWADQGVLLLNTALTVEDGQPPPRTPSAAGNSDGRADRAGGARPLARFPAVGAHAQAKQALLPGNSGHLVLMSNHPSPLSARRPPVPFLGCGHFAATNCWLVDQGKTLLIGHWTKIIPRQGEFGL